MKKKDKKILIIVSIILGVILLVVSQNGFKKGFSVVSDTSPTTSKISRALTLTDACGECGGTCYADYFVCCEIPGWTFDPSTEECNPPTQGDCSNDPSKNLDCSRYCTEPGHVYAYNFDVCCAPQNPYTPDGRGCYTTPQPGADNYYTRKSECTSTSETKCQGDNLYQCTENPQFIYKYTNKGQVTGQCGIQCNTLSDCSGNLPNCQSTQTCDYSCGWNECIAVGTSNYYRLENNICNSINLLPSQVTQNDYLTLAECQSKIINPPSKFNWELIIGIILILGIIGFVIYRYKGKRRK